MTGIWHGANWPCVTYGAINGILVCLNKYWRGLKIEINKYLAVAITFTTMIFIAPLVMIKTMPQYFKVLTSMLGVNTEFAPIIISDFQLQFLNGSQLGIFLIAISMFVIFCLPNSNQLADKYVKNNKPIFAIILAFVFIYSALSITQTSKFIYFQF